MDQTFYKKLAGLMFPIVFQNLMLASVAVADAIMLGSVEQNSMAAVSLATQIQFIQNMFLGAIVASVAILGAQYWGKGDQDTLNDIFCMALRLCGAVSVVAFVGCVFFPQYLMRIFTNETVLIDIGISYLQLAGWSYLLTGITQCYLTIMKISGRAQYYSECGIYLWMVRTSGYGRARSSARDIDCTYSGTDVGDRILMEERIHPSAAFALFPHQSGAGSGFCQVCTSAFRCESVLGCRIYVLLGVYGASWY